MTDPLWRNAPLLLLRFPSLAAGVVLGACLVATHDPEVLERVDRIVRLEDGAVVA